MPSPVSATPVSVFNDPVSGKEVWQMTNGSGHEHPDYYTSPLFSPNGKYFVYHDSNSSASPSFLSIMNSDGSSRRRFGSRADQSGGAQSFGWWSHDSKYYYAAAGLYRKNSETAADEEFTTNPSQYLPFNFPMVSPDGRVISGIANMGDSQSQGTLKFINTDGSNYYSYLAPGWKPPYQSGVSSFDVTHGWVGNNQVWYLNNSIESLYRDILRVVDVNTRQYVGTLNAVVPDGNSNWSGIFDHPQISDEGYMVGGSTGMVSGSGSSANGIISGWGRANTLLVNTQADVAAKNFTAVVSSSFSEFTSVDGASSNYSPDGKWLAVNGVRSNCGVIAAYPIDKTKSPQWLATWGPSTSCEWDSGQGPYVTWSPDGTKVIYGSKYDIQISRSQLKTNSNMDMYVAVFKKPDAPTNLSVSASGGSISLTWTPAFSHREIKEYEVERSQSPSGPWTAVASVPEIYTYLDAPSKIGTGDTAISVDSTSGFPNSGVLEIYGLSSQRPTELVYYTGKTENSFTGLTRGYKNTTAAEHYNDSFVWLSRTGTGYTESSSSASYFRVRSVEWSGLKSEYSNPVGATLSVTPTSLPNPGDANGDRKVDGVDYIIWLNHYNQNVSGQNNGDFNNSGAVNGEDFVIWLNNYGS